MRLINIVSLVALQLFATKIIVFASGQVDPTGQGADGHVDPYIIGGDDAIRMMHPWMVGIYFGCFDSCEPDERCYNYLCGGTLISPNWVLTAAHCIERTWSNLHYFQVYVGDYDFMKDDNNTIQLAVMEIKEHPNYTHTTTTVENDIALIKLNQSVEETSQTKCLRLADNRDSLMTDCHLFGWGMARQDDTSECQKSHTLKYVNLTQVDLDTCRRNYPDKTIYNKSVCAGGEEGQGACSGDSGGGLYCPTKNKSTYELLGIASWTKTSPCASSDKPTVFTDATAFRQWINENCENCLEDYNKNNCRNPVDLYPIIPTTTPGPPCMYPLDPSNGHYICSNSDAGEAVGVGEDCTLQCYNRENGGYKTCQQNGHYNETNLTEANCSNSTSYCEYPTDPQDGHFQCPENADGTVSSGQVCFFRCYNGHFGGTIQCRPNQSYDESNKFGCGISKRQCPYPPDPTGLAGHPTGHFQCPTSSPGGMVDNEGVCGLRCYNGLYGSYIKCINGMYDKSNLEEYKCLNAVTVKTTPVTTTTGPTTTKASGCPYPDSPPNGTYSCPETNPGDLVDIDKSCYLVCDNGHYAGSIVCKENGQFDKSDVNEDECSEEPSTTTPKVTTTTPTPEDSCPYPSPPVPGATYNCPPFTQDDIFISSGTICYLLCKNGTTIAGFSVCLENGQFDESELEKWKCYPVTDCHKVDKNYIGHDLNHVDDVETWMQCGVLCKDHQECTHWTLHWKHGKECSLKKGHAYADPTNSTGSISGERECP